MCRQSGSVSNLSSFLFLIAALLIIISIPHAVQGYEKTPKSVTANFSGTQLPWEIITIDGGANSEQNSIAIDSKDKVHIAYLDMTNPAGPALKYATNASGSWVISYIDQGTVVGGLGNIAIDLDDEVHIVYYDGAKGQVKYVTNALGSWVASVVDGSFLNTFPSVAIDSHNKVHISYLSYDNCLKYATNASGSWVISTIDTFEAFGNHTSIAVDSNGKIYITYHTASGSTIYLKYATNASGSWVTNTIDWYDIGPASSHSIVVDSNNRTHVLYTNRTTDELTCTTNSSGSWVKTIIDHGGYTWGGGPSMAIDSNDALHICYFILIPIQNNAVTIGDLKYGTNASGAWATYTIDNIGFAPSIAVDSNNKVHIAYCGIEDVGLKYATNSARTQYTFTISKSGTGDGRVTSNPSGMDCGSTCTASYDEGTIVTLTANPSSGSTFAGWSGACSGSGGCVLTMDSDKSVTATFNSVGGYSLTVLKTGTGDGTVTSSPAGISCGSACSETFQKVTKVKLTAKVNPGSLFTGWSGGGCTGTKPCQVTVDSAITLAANFDKKIAHISVSLNTLDLGSVKVKKSLKKTLKIMNNGTGDLTVSIGGLGGTDFSVSGRPSITVKPSKSYNLGITFKPSSTGSKTTTLVLTTNDPTASTISISLTGTGT